MQAQHQHHHHHHHHHHQEVVMEEEVVPSRADGDRVEWEAALAGARSNLPFRPFTCATLARLMAALDGASTSCTGAPSPAPLFRDGEQRRHPDESLGQGTILAPRLREALPLGLLGDPLEDLDPYYRNSHKTFVVVNAERRVHRFSAERSLWLFGPHNAVRRLALRVCVVPCFERTMLLLILAHLAAQVLFISLPGTSAYEFPFIFVYAHEMGLKIVARGFFMQPFSYLRDPWNVLDGLLTVIWCACMIPYWEISGALQALRALRVIRYVQESTSCSPEHKAVTGGMGAALLGIFRAAPLLLLSLGVVSLVGVELNAGVLTRKCVRDPPPGAPPLSPDDLRAFFSNPANWYAEESGEYALCGNTTGAWKCPLGHVARASDDEDGFLQTLMNFTCRQGYGRSPQGMPQSTFDSFTDGLLTALRIMTSDTLSDLFHKFMRVAGPMCLTFFLPALVTCALLTCNLVSAVVVSSLESVVRLQRRLQRLQDHHPRHTAEETSITIGTPYIVASEAPSPSKSDHRQDPTITNVDETDNDADDDEECPSPGITTESSSSSGRDPVEVAAPAKCRCLRTCLQKIISDPRIELLLLGTLGCDAVAMVSFHHGLDASLLAKLRKADFIFTCVYGGEAVLKLIALGPRIYLRDACHLFELAMAFTSASTHLVRDEALLPLLRAATTMRLVRLATLASLWRPAALLERRIRAAGRMLALTTLHLSGFLVVLAIVCTRIFKPMLIQYWSAKGQPPPRWACASFAHSLLAMFRTFLGRWSQPLAALQPAVPLATALPLFLLALLAGKLIISNLFLASLLVNPRPRGWRRGHELALWSGSRLPELVDWIRHKCGAGHKAAKTTVGTTANAAAGINRSRGNSMEQMEVEATPRASTASTGGFVAGACPWTQGKRWACLRNASFRILHNCLFRLAVTLVIIAGVVVAGLDDNTLEQRPRIAFAMDFIDAGLTAFLALELLLRILAHGPTHLIQDPLQGLDFAILFLSLAGLTAPRGGPGDGPLLRASRASRSLRLARLLRWWRGCRRLGAALIDALPSLLAAFLSCFGCLFIYACMGVQLFGGLFHKCVDQGGNAVSHDAVPTRAACEKEGLTWQNAKLTFDHFWSALLSLLHVATLEGWEGVVTDATDARAPNLQPIRDVNLYACAYFGLFLLLAAFLYIRLFIVALLEALLRQKGTTLDMFHQAAMRQYCSAMKKLERWQPQHYSSPPKWRLGRALHQNVQSHGWEAGCVALGVLQLIPLSLSARAAHPAWADGLKFISCSMALLLCFESAARFLSGPKTFFCSALNLADAVGAIGALMEGTGALPRVIGATAVAQLPSPALLRLVRVWGRTGTLLMRCRMTRPLGVAWSAMSNATANLVAVAILLSLHTVVLSTVGMALFGGPIPPMPPPKPGVGGVILGVPGVVPPTLPTPQVVVEQEAMFKTFPAAAGTLLPVLLGGFGWHRLLATLLEASPASRVVVMVFVLASLLPSVVLTAFFPAILIAEVMAAEDEAETGVTEWIADDFHWAWRGAVWSAAAYGASSPSTGNRWQLLPASHVAEALAMLPAPLRPLQLGRCKVAALSIPVVQGDAVHPLDAADALLTDLLQRRGHSRRYLPPRQTPPPSLLSHRRDAAAYRVVSSTMLRQRQDRSARVIQVAWHKYKTFGGQYDLR